MTQRATAFLMIVLVATVGATQSNWNTHTTGGEYAFARGDFARAEREFQTALEIANGFPEGDKRLETSLENLGRLYEHDSDFDKAQPMYELLLAAREHRLGPDHPALMDVLFAVARVSQPSGDLPTVTASLNRYAEIAESSGKGDPRKNWQAFQLLSRNLLLQDDEVQALRWQRSAAEAIAEDLRATDEERANVIESAANLEITAGEGAAAEMLLAEVARLRISEGLPTTIAETMNRGAATAFGAGRFETAEVLAERALKSEPEGQTELGALTMLADVSWARVNRGTDDLEILLSGAQDDEDLVTASARLTSVIEAKEEPDIKSMRRLVQVEALRGRPEAALSWQRQVIASGASGDAAMVSARKDLVTLLAAAGKTDEALTENTSAMTAAEARYGETSAQILQLLEQRARIATAAGNKKEAKKANKQIKKLSR